MTNVLLLLIATGVWTHFLYGWRRDYRRDRQR